MTTTPGPPAGPGRRDRGRRPRADDPDARIAALAARQHGVVSRTQLLDAGITRHALDHRIARRRLVPVFRGVYRVGPIVAPYARAMAAVLACGPHAALSHRSAAVLWGLLPSVGGAGPIDVTVPGGFRAPAAAIRLHRTRVLPRDDIACRHGIAITTAARTLVDLAGAGEPRELERALAQAERTGLADPAAIRAVLDRTPRRRGSARLRSLLDVAHPTTRSEAEERFVALVRRSGLRMPEVNAILHGYEVDCLWRAEGLVVEIDGFAFHGSRDAFEQDRRRDGALMAAGFRVRRITWRQLTRAPEALLVSIAQLLAGASPP